MQFRLEVLAVLLGVLAFVSSSAAHATAARLFDCDAVPLIDSETARRWILPP